MQRSFFNKSLSLRRTWRLFKNFIPKTHYRYFVFVVSLPEIPINSHVEGYMTRGPVGWSRSITMSVLEIMIKYFAFNL